MCRFVAIAAVLALSAATSACGDDTLPGGGSDQGGSPGAGGGQGGDDCADGGGQCLVVPAGFVGPVQVNDNGVATCVSEAFHGAFEASAIFAPDAICGCACAADGAACSLAGLAFSDGACEAVDPVSFELDAGACVDLPDVDAASPLGVQLQADPTAADCVNDLAPAMLPPIAFEPNVVGCNVNIDSCAGGGVCVPQVGRYCIHSTTETSCPAGFEESHTVLREADVTDTRECECGCGAATVTCAPAISLFSGADCTGDLVHLSVSDCHFARGTPPLGSALVDDGLVATCETTTTASGGIDVTGAGMLLCCAP